MKMCFMVLPSVTNDKGEFTALIVKEGESGYYLTDWTWGTDFEVAEQIAKKKNEARGLSEKDVDDLILQSMR